MRRRLAAEGTKFQAGFSGIGLSPDSTTSYFLPRLLGLAVATRMMPFKPSACASASTCGC
jgi:enoyl-CoA hydratase/carnithine racemase